MVGALQTEGWDLVEFTEPESVETSRTIVSEGVHIILGGKQHRAMAGEAHLAIISRDSEAVLDIEHIPLLAAFGLVYDEDDGDPPQVQAMQKKGQVSKDIEHWILTEKIYSISVCARQGAVHCSPA